MKKAICKALLRMVGWKLGPVSEDVPKCVICVAPHTSNWDFIVGKLFYTALGRNASFLIKKNGSFFRSIYCFRGWVVCLSTVINGLR